MAPTDSPSGREPERVRMRFKMGDGATEEDAKKLGDALLNLARALGDEGASVEVMKHTEDIRKIVVALRARLTTESDDG